MQQHKKRMDVLPCMVSYFTGARVGLAVEVRDRLQVSWLDPADPTKGFSHLYLVAEDYEHLQALAHKTGTGRRSVGALVAVLFSGL